MKPPRRILIFSLAYYPRFVGGAEVAVKEITDRISPEEIVFDMVTLRGDMPAFERVGNVNVHRVGMERRQLSFFSKFLYILQAYSLAINLHKQNNYDAVWPIMASYAGAAAVLFKKKFPEVPVLLTIQEGDNFERRQGVFNLLFKRIFRSADRIQAISNYLAQWSKDMGAICAIEVIPNGVDYEHFAKPMDPDLRSRLRSEMDVKENEIVLVTASRLVHKNAVDDIISSLRFLDKSYKLLILGTGMLEDGLKGKAVELGLADQVIFKGYVPHSDLPQYLQASDIFVRPSRSEGLGNSFLEAMAAGIPVIATPVGGIPDFLKDGENGLFCEVDNPESIAQKVGKLSKDKESRDFIVKSAREMVERKYRWEGIADKMKGIMSGLVRISEERPR